MKKAVSFLLAAVMLLTLAPLAGAARGGDIDIYVNDVYLYSDVPPMIVNGRTMVPLAAISENLGCRVEWNASQRSVVVYSPIYDYDDALLVLTIDDPYVTVNWYDDSGDFGGNVVKIDAAPMIYKGRTMVPLSFIAGQLGYSASWDGDNRIVYLSSAFSDAPADGRGDLIDDNGNVIDPDPEPISQADAEELVWQILTEQEEEGLSLVGGGEDTVNGEHAIIVIAGNKSADGKKFTGLYHFAVTDSGVVYYMDPVQGSDWILYEPA